ncbi:hypothetical protein GCM10010976_26530 [Bizionia arctica]|uniref:Gliding motility-associated C-terminal domain-containing protein n=1 Tax=Bizionia arctica TaxID=1495645 RepID=A0A917GR91_9FLAO|nr:hypothetical protein GCM10010976_26530 [Bizionia arctica]
MFLGNILFSHAQCPTIVDSTQNFCDLESLLVSDLQATNNGGGVFWYDTATSTTPLAGSTSLINGQDYFADDNTGSCGVRGRVVVAIIGPPTGLNFQGVCVVDANDATISNLVVTGNNVQWYLSPTSVLPLSPTTILMDNTIYYANQASPDASCRSSRLSVLVNVGIVPAPTGDSIQTFCLLPDFGLPTVSELVANGNNIQWYASESSASPLDPTTTLVDGESYYATISDPPCESFARLEVIVQFLIQPSAGFDGSLEICENDTNTFDLIDSINGTPDLGGIWSPPLNSGTGVFDPAVDAPGIYTYTVYSPDPACSDDSATVTVSIITPPEAGNDGSLEICEADTNTYDLFNSLGGSPDSGGTWSPTLNSGTGLFDPTLDGPGIYTYTVNSSDPACSNASASVTVSFATPPVAGNNGSLEICEDDTSTYNLIDSLGGSPDSGGTWSPTLNSGTGLFDPALDAPGTYTYTVFSADPACLDASATVIVSIIIPPVAGNDGSLEICEDDTNTYDLINYLGGTPDAGGTWAPSLNSGTGLFDPTLDAPGTYTYTVFSSDPACSNASASVTVAIIIPPVAGTDGSLEICEDDTNTYNLFNSLGGSPDSGGTWSPTLNSGTGLFDPALDAPGTYTYTVGSNTTCNDASASVTVSFITPPIAGNDGSLEICEDDTNTYDLFNSLGGTPDSGGTWSPTLNSGTGIFNPALDAPGIYTYTVNSSDPACSHATASVNVSFVTPPVAGNNGSLEICEDDTNTYDLFNSLGGTPDSGGTWSPALNSGTGLFDPALDAPGTYTYTVGSNTTCNDASASVTVSFITPPIAGIDGSLEICEDDTNTYDLFNSLGGTPDSGGTWSPTLNSGTGIFNPALDAPGTYTYTVNSTDPACSHASASVTVLFVTPPLAGNNGSLEICEDDTNTYDLFNSLGGTPDSGGTWSPALNSGTGLFDPALDAPGTYTYTVGSNTTCNDASATVTVSFITPPIAGNDGSLEICEDDTNTYDLFNSLDGTPDSGGTWSPTLNSGTGIFDPALDAPGIYTYTVASSGTTCNNASASVTVSFVMQPEAGTDGSLEICEDDTNTYDLFNSLGGTPDSDGTWSPTLNSGTGLFDPAIDAPGTYTYTVSRSGSTCIDASASVAVSFIEPPLAGIDGSLDICEDDTNTYDLFNSLGGTPDTGGIWSPALNSGTGLFNPAFDAPGTYTYTVVSSNGVCNDASASVTVSLITAPVAGLNGILEICPDDSNTYDLFNSLGGTPDSGGTWSPSLNSGTGVFDPALDTAGTYTYTVTSSSPVCNDASASVTVSIVAAPVAGIDGSLGICEGDTNTYDLFNSLGGAPTSGGTWLPALNSGSGIFDPAIDAPGTYTYSVTNRLCDLSDSAEVTVTISELPDATGLELSLNNICEGEDLIITITNANALDNGNYLIIYNVTGADIFTGSALVTINNGEGNFVILADAFTITGEYELTIIDFISESSNCGADTSLIIPINFEVYVSITPVLIDQGNVFCVSDEPTIEDLSNNITNSGDLTWYDSSENGNIIPPNTLLIDGETYYASILTSQNCPSLIRLAVTVELDECIEDLLIPDGFSPNGDNINDTFHINHLDELYPNFKLTIFNRYGNKLYNGNINTPDWDGKSNTGSSLGDSIVPVGVYFFILEFNDGNREPLQGRVYLNM